MLTLFDFIDVDIILFDYIFGGPQIIASKAKHIDLHIYDDIRRICSIIQLVNLVVSSIYVVEYLG